MTEETPAPSEATTPLQPTDPNTPGEGPKPKENKKEKCRPMTKVVIRRLPPTMTQEQFMEQVSPLPEYDYLHFAKADSSLGPFACSRAYINFVNAEDIFEFREKFDNYVFVDAKGVEYTAVVEYAPFQRVPKKRIGKKKDLKCATIESDPYYVTFLESMQNQEADSSNNQPKTEYSFQLSDHSSKKITTTPLLDFLKQRKQEKQRLRDEKREEKRRRDIERKRSKDEPTVSKVSKNYRVLPSFFSGWKGLTRMDLPKEQKVYNVNITCAVASLPMGLAGVNISEEQLRICSERLRALREKRNKKEREEKSESVVVTEEGQAPKINVEDDKTRVSVLTQRIAKLSARISNVYHLNQVNYGASTSRAEGTFETQESDVDLDSDSSDEEISTEQLENHDTEIDNDVNPENSDNSVSNNQTDDEETDEDLETEVPISDMADDSSPREIYRKALAKLSAEINDLNRDRSNSDMTDDSSPREIYRQAIEELSAEINDLNRDRSISDVIISDQIDLSDTDSADIHTSDIESNVFPAKPKGMPRGYAYSFPAIFYGGECSSSSKIVGEIEHPSLQVYTVHTETSITDPLANAYALPMIVDRDQGTSTEIEETLETEAISRVPISTERVDRLEAQICNISLGSEDSDSETEACDPQADAEPEASSSSAAVDSGEGTSSRAEETVEESVSTAAATDEDSQIGKRLLRNDSCNSLWSILNNLKQENLAEVSTSNVESTSLSEENSIFDSSDVRNIWGPTIDTEAQSTATSGDPSQQVYNINVNCRNADHFWWPDISATRLPALQPRQDAAVYNINVNCNPNTPPVMEQVRITRNMTFETEHLRDWGVWDPAVASAGPSENNGAQQRIHVHGPPPRYDYRYPMQPNRSFPTRGTYVRRPNYNNNNYATVNRNNSRDETPTPSQPVFKGYMYQTYECDGQTFHDQYAIMDRGNSHTGTQRRYHNRRHYDPSRRNSHHTGSRQI